MFVSIHMTDEVAQDLRRRVPQLSESQHILKTLSDRGLRIQPLHGDTPDSELARHFYVRVPSAEVAEEVERHLSGSPAVEAVYVKPPDAAPS